MHNPDLAKDYVLRAKARLRALDILFEEQSYADVVRESQEVVELCLKALLRVSGIDPPRIHDVSEILLAETKLLPQALQSDVALLAKISRSLRRDRELAFYGAEDLTPSGFYSEEDAIEALQGAKKTVELVAPHIGPKEAFRG